MKRLYKTRKGNMVDGVCGGIANYLEVDPTIIRLLWVAFCFFYGGGFLAYLICMIIIPREPLDEENKGE